MRLDSPYHREAIHLLKNLYGTKGHDLNLHNRLFILEFLIYMVKKQLLGADSHLQMLKVDDERKVANQFYLLT